MVSKVPPRANVMRAMARTGRADQRHCCRPFPQYLVSWTLDISRVRSWACRGALIVLKGMC